jgi:hypothetical protein
MSAAVITLEHEGVWLDQTSFSNAEELFYCRQAGTVPSKRTKSPGPVTFDPSVKGQRGGGGRGAAAHQNKPHQNTHNSRYNPNHQNQHYNQQHNQPYSHHHNNYNQQAPVVQQGGGGYYRNPNYYHPGVNHPQFGEIKQHIAQARQTIQRALRHSSSAGQGNRNSGGSWNGRNSGSRNSGSWNNNRNSGSGNDWKRNSGGQNSGVGQNGGVAADTRRIRTVSFEDSSGDLNLRIKQLEQENAALHKLTGTLESQIAVLLERVNNLESSNASPLSNGVH